jgi:SPP1 family predicted phage head-tail adaptor
MRAGRLDRRVTIERKTVTRDDYGAEIITWSTFAQVWAEVREVNSVEKVIDQLRTMSRLTMVTIRWVPGVTTDMRIRVDQDGRILAITSLAEIGRKVGWTIACEQYSA